MMASREGVFLDRSVRALFGAGAAASRSDADLVRQFLDGHAETSEAAFEALVARHGPMVLGVSRRIVGDSHAAEDIFQAVFLILARRAGHVRVEDSLGRWLHGVTRRVARQARCRAPRATASLPVSLADDPDDDPLTLASRAEAIGMIDREVARLPRKYRDAVRLHHLDGLSHDQAAEALGLPVGTVRSRLSRGRGLLRSRLVRRGLAPAALVAWLGSRPAAAAVPRALIAITLKNLKSLGAIGRSVPIDPAVLALIQSTMRRIVMMKVLGALGLAVLLGAGGLSARAVVAAREDNPPPSPAAVAAKPEPPEDQLARIIREFEEANDRAKETLWQKEPFEYWKGRHLYPDDVRTARRIVEIAEAQPKGRSVRDALIWIVRRPHWPRNTGSIETDPFELLHARAVDLLVTHHADDPEVARLGLEMADFESRTRDAFLEGVYTMAQNREARGLARMALANYLMSQARSVEGQQLHTARSRSSYTVFDEAGKEVQKEGVLSAAEESYCTHLRLLDAESLRRRAERLYEEVIAEYADLTYVTTTRLNMEREVRATPSATIVDPARKRRKEVLREYEQILALDHPIPIPDIQKLFPEAGHEFDVARKPTTLGQEAARRLEAHRRRSLIGKLAPDLVWTSIDGKPVKLSDHRGKVVVLTYWDRASSNCLQAIPDERALAEALKGRPFTFLGVAVDTNPADARKVVEDEHIPWPMVTGGRDLLSEVFFWADGLYSSPTYVVIDVDGMIRGEGGWNVRSIRDLVERLVREAEARAKRPGS